MVQSTLIYRYDGMYEFEMLEPISFLKRWRFLVKWLPK